MSCKPCASSVLAAIAFSGGFSPATSSPIRWAAAANASTLCLSSSGVFACSPCPTSDCALAASVLTFAIAARYAVGDSWVVVVSPPPPPPQAASRRTATAAMQAIPPRTAANLTDRPATLRPMFDTLSEKLQSDLVDLRGRGVLDEEAISLAMREVRLALLEADVNFGVVKEFVAHVRERALGEDVRKSLTPGQQVVKIVHEELTELLGSSDSRLAFSQRPPTTILPAGLQGSGKTTTAGKLALLLFKEVRKPALVAADLQRPAAIDQLVQLGEQGGGAGYADERGD